MLANYFYENKHKVLIHFNHFGEILGSKIHALISHFNLKLKVTHLSLPSGKLYTRRQNKTQDK